MTTGSEPLLQLDEVRTHFPRHRGIVLRRRIGTVKAVDGVSFSLRRGEVLGLVGESGCGKSTLARTIVRLVAPTAGRILLEGRDLAPLDEPQLRRLRPAMQMVFQDPYASLNPRLTIFDALAEPLLVHGRATRRAVGARVSALLEQVGLSAGAAHRYPHEFSGGQRQRIAIARALALEPRLLIADEPVSALDVSVQAQIVNLLATIGRERQLAMLFIAHDLAVVKHVSDRIAVMYLGRIVELGDAAPVIERPRHPYTRALISAIPQPDPVRERERASTRIVLAGEPPSPLAPPPGCAFHPRCPHAVERCRRETPPLAPVRDDGRLAACWRVDEIP